ncbi:AEC family transporter [Feifania hominis]|uniref:AEC family transporter n=1 Tax=Feifania hominis TaxID=2763660 RepID=A0A926DF81_9FIRM|nr:AEC family transporter [Feifania hominis]MBC8536709.1 AEC family transporter [Feifania hominis]
MQVEFSVVLTQFLFFGLMILIGFLSIKLRLIDGQVLSSVAMLIARLIMPCMIFGNIAGVGTLRELLAAWPMLLAGLVELLFMIALGMATARLARLRGDRHDAYVAAHAFSNSGFMGIPLMESLYGAAGILRISLYSLPENALMWTLGVHLTTGRAERAGRAGGLRATAFNMLRQPTVLALLLGIAALVLRVDPDNIVVDTIAGIGGTSKYIAMLYLGGSIAFLDFKSFFRERSIFLLIASKLIVAPLALYYLLRLLPVFSPEVALTAAIVASLPAMSSTAIFARAGNSEAADYVTQCVMMTTLFSLVTIPFVLWLCR